MDLQTQHAILKASQQAQSARQAHASQANEAAAFMFANQTFQQGNQEFQSSVWPRRRFIESVLSFLILLSWPVCFYVMYQFGPHYSKITPVVDSAIQFVIANTPLTSQSYFQPALILLVSIILLIIASNIRQLKPTHLLPSRLFKRLLGAIVTFFSLPVFAYSIFYLFVDLLDLS